MIKGISTVSLQSGVPVTMGILTTNNLEQAIERSGTKMGNKGWEAAWLQWNKLIFFANWLKI